MIKLKRKKTTLIIFILINILSYYQFFRIDLTSENRYSLEVESKRLINELDDIIHFKIFLHGDIPIEYKKLEQEIYYILDEFRVHSKFITYDFIDPSESENIELKNNLYQELYKKGIQAIPHRTYNGNKSEETWIFPGITLTYKTKEISTSLIDKAVTNNTNIIIKNSIENLEHLLISSIRKVKMVRKKSIGIITGHGETIDKNIESFKNDIAKYYEVEQIKINEKLVALDNFDCIIINNPKEYFSEKDKFIIDQFIMNGGKSIWLMSGTTASLDSLESQGEHLVMPFEDRNLHDLMFNYGIRLNMDLIQDLQAAPIPIVTHYVKEKPQWSFFPWVFFPVISPTNTHIINTRIDPIKLQFPSSIDTLSKNSTSNTILLQTSKNSKTITIPTLINLESLKMQPNKKEFKEKNKITSVLVEGVFNSVFESRLTHVFKKDTNINFQAKSMYNKMIVISDGYFINNQFSQGVSLPIGFDKHTRQTYGNGEFIINCIDYLMGNDQYIKIRSKKIALRLLNKQKVIKEKTYWQIINFILPIIIISMITFIFFLKRKKTYSN